MNPQDVDAVLPIPYSFGEMVRQSSSAIRDAYAAGKTRHILRILLPRTPTSGQIGRFFESDVAPFLDDRNANNEEIVKLVPPDETWQGGSLQLYRSCAPTVQEILKQVHLASSATTIPPRLLEDRSVDESGVDGIGLWIAQGISAQDDISCFVQPTQETISRIEQLSKEAGGRLVALVNPQWRTADDALDAASRQDSFLGTLASFLGGKGNSLKTLEDLGYEPIYSYEGYVCKGGNVRLIKRFDQQWGIYAENDAGTDYVLVGKSPIRPKYQDVEKMLDSKGISLKYARDIGLAPKF
jgi:Domain of unknown function (DUF1995)